MSNIKSINAMSNFKTQKVVEMYKIFNLKLLTKKILEFLNSIEVITSYNHVIYIQEKQNNAFVVVTKK